MRSSIRSGADVRPWADSNSTNRKWRSGPEGVKALDDPDAVVVQVTVPQAEPEPAAAAPAAEQAEPEIIGRKAAEEEAEAEK